MAIKIQGTTVIDDSRNATNLGDITASGDVNFTGSGSFKVPSGTTSQRPASPSVGEIRYNTDNGEFEQYDGSAWVSLAPPIEKGSLDKTFVNGESASISLSEPISGAPIVSVTKEIPQTGVTNNDWDVASDGANYTLHDTAYDTTLTQGEIGYAIDAASYDSVSLDVSQQDTGPSSIAFNNDGTQMYIVDDASNGVDQYSLSTAFDLSTASYDNVSFNVVGQDQTPNGIAFNNDGTQMYIVGNNTGFLYQYSLSTAFDLSTASYDNVSFDVSGQETSVKSVKFNNDGTQMYIVGVIDDSVYQYTLSTAFDLSTASYDNVSFDVSGQATGPQEIAFNGEGSRMYIVGNNTESVYEYSLTTAFDLSTANYSSVSFSVSGQDGNPESITFNTDGTKMYIVGGSSESVYQYSTSKEGLVLGSGSFASTDVGKRIVGNGGEAILTATDGSYEEQSAFNDSSTIAAGDWSMFALDVESADAGLTLTGVEIGDPAFDIQNASYDSVSFDVSGQETNPTGIEFNTDGTKMYIVGNSDSVHQYSLTTSFDISTASYDSVSFDASSQDPSPKGFTFSTDGTKMYIVGAANDSVHQYTLSTSFDLSTTSYDEVSFSVSGQETAPQDIAFNTEGSKMYIVGNINDSVHQYTLSTPFDLSTASYDSVSFDASSQDTAPTGVTFNTEGTKMYVAGASTDSVYQYTLSTAFDLSTASYDNVSFDASSQDSGLNGFTFSKDGTKMYTVGSENEFAYQYTTGTLNFFNPTSANHTAITSLSIDSEFWTDINSMTADDESNDGSVYYAVSTDDRTTWSIIDDTDGERNIVRNNAGTWEVNDASDYGSETWVAASENDEFYALEEAVELSTAQFSFDVTVGFTDASTWSYDSVSFDVSSQDSNPYGIAFNTDGTQMYMVGSNSDSVHQYTLSTAFDVSTASYDSVSLSVSGQDSAPSGIDFNTDGSKMYIVGVISDSVHQYTLSTPFDLSTASYDNVSFDVSGQESSPRDLAFNNGGTQMYMVGDSVHQYTLSTPFDLSTASYDSVSFSVSGEDSNPSGIAFNTDGTQMYMVGFSSESVHQYTLSTAFDVSTASYDSVSFDVSGQDTNPRDIAFNTDGTQMYISGDSSESVHQYTTSSTSTQFDSRNRMDSEQLNAVTDPNHYTLGDDLDLAITLFMADGNVSSPTSDGVSINYDANVLNQGAILGTDYEFDNPANDKVRIKALSNENLKVRVV